MSAVKRLALSARTALAVCACIANMGFGGVALADDSAIQLNGDGLMHTQSAYSVEETVNRIRADVEAKGIKFFADIDQSELGKGAGIELEPSRLLIFGNPPLGVLFLTSAADSGMDWPVRMLVRQEKDGEVLVVYQNWDWVAERYGIEDRVAEFSKATEVVMSIVSSVSKCKEVAECTH
ncbi:MAG: DUF302 domain-containing protein [Nitratireductor sp.]|nr:DUF302 domain-containing protein [Nitratireductor sp.]